MKRVLGLILTLSSAVIVAESYQYYLDHANKPIPYAVLNPRTIVEDHRRNLNNVAILELAIKNYSTFADTNPDTDWYSELFISADLKEKQGFLNLERDAYTFAVICDKCNPLSNDHWPYERQKPVSILLPKKFNLKDLKSALSDRIAMDNGGHKLPPERFTISITTEHGRSVSDDSTPIDRNKVKKTELAFFISNQEIRERNDELLRQRIMTALESFFERIKRATDTNKQRAVEIIINSINGQNP